mgnify:CR=1 FL=1
MTLRRYERYKDSGVEWLGAVPAHWEVQAIKRLLLSVEQGWSPQCENFPAESGQWGVLKVGCVNGGRFNADENKALPVDLEPLPELGIRRGDVLVSRANTRELVGSVAVADRDYEHLLLCDKLYRLRVRPDRCEPSFLAHFIGGTAARSVIEAAATGASSSMLNIAQGAIVGMPMAVPPPGEQRALLRFLGAETAKIDALIAEQQRLIELLNEKRQAAIAQVVTKGLNPSTPMKDSGVEWLGEVPSRWRVVPVKYLADVGNGSTPHRDRADYWTGGDYPWLSSTVVNGEVVLEADEFVTELALTECHLPKVTPPAVLIGITGQGKTRGMSALLGIEATINQHIAFVRPRDNSTSAEFLRRYFETAYQRMRFESDGVGSTKGAITCEQISNMRVPVPPREQQDAIVVRLRHITSELDRLALEATTAIELLRDRRTALISAAVTGQIDVRDSESVESALAETRADIAAGRYVVESAAAHLARVQAMTAADEHPPSLPVRAKLNHIDHNVHGSLP